MALSIDAWGWAAIGFLLLGGVIALAGRWREGLGAWARLFWTVALAVLVTGMAINLGHIWIWWLSGFTVCVALHRLVDAVLRRE
jgi:hypothetical protein